MLRKDGGQGSYRADTMWSPIQVLNRHQDSTLKEAAKNCMIMLAGEQVLAHGIKNECLQYSGTLVLCCCFVYQLFYFYAYSTLEIYISTIMSHRSYRNSIKHRAACVTKSSQDNRVKKWLLHLRKWMSNTSDLTALLISHQQAETDESNHHRRVKINIITSFHHETTAGMTLFVIRISKNYALHKPIYPSSS